MIIEKKKETTSEIISQITSSTLRKSVNHAIWCYYSNISTNNRALIGIDFPSRGEPTSGSSGSFTLLDELKKQSILEKQIALNFISERVVEFNPITHQENSTEAKTELRNKADKKPQFGRPK